MWLRCFRPDGNSVWAPLLCCFWKDLLKEHFLDIYLIIFLRVPNFRNTSAMRAIFCLKIIKLNVNFRNSEKNWEKVICLWDNSIWIGCVKLSLLRREYLSPAFNVLTSTLKVSNGTKRDFFQLNFLHCDQ